MQPSMATLPAKLLHQPRNLVIVELILSPILFIAGIHFPHVLLHNQGYPKVCPDPLNPSNAGDSFAGISSLTSCYLFLRTRDLIALV
jgi:energy-converting hydrogenase Eha subunit F